LFHTTPRRQPRVEQELIKELSCAAWQLFVQLNVSDILY